MNKFSDRKMTISPNLWYKSGSVLKNGVIDNKTTIKDVKQSKNKLIERRRQNRASKERTEGSGDQAKVTLGIPGLDS